MFQQRFLEEQQEIADAKQEADELYEIYQPEKDRVPPSVFAPLALAYQRVIAKLQSAQRLIRQGEENDRGRIRNYIREVNHQAIPQMQQAGLAIDEHLRTRVAVQSPPRPGDDTSASAGTAPSQRRPSR